MASYVVATGNIGEGITQIVGPFPTSDEADAFIDAHDDSLSEGVCQAFWFTVQSPAEYLGEA